MLQAMFEDVWVNQQPHGTCYTMSKATTNKLNYNTYIQI